MPLDLNQKHALYDLVNETRKTASDLIAGAIAVKKEGEMYLFKTQNETNTQYSMRLRRAVYDNWAGVVLMTRLALLWKKEPTRELAVFSEEIINDIDGNGTDADSFFLAADRMASAAGMAFIHIAQSEITMEKDAEGKAIAVNADGKFEYLPNDGVLTKAQEITLNIRPYFSLVNSKDVYDWDFDQNGLLYLVLASRETIKGGAGIAPIVSDVRTVWTRGNWAEYRMDEKAEWQIVKEGPNPLGEVPFIPRYGFKESEFLGWPVVRDILTHAIAIYNKQSDRDVSEFQVNNATPYVISQSKPDSINAAHGNAIHLTPMPGIQTQIGYLEPTGKGIELGRESERELISRIFETALRQAKPFTKLVKSDATLQAEESVYNSSLAASAKEGEVCELRCWKMACLGMGVDDSKITVSYNKNFEYGLLSEGMLNTYSTMAEKSQLPVRTLLEIMIAANRLPKDYDIEAALVEIENDASKMGLSGFTAPNVNTDNSGENVDNENNSND